MSAHLQEVSNFREVNLREVQKFREVHFREVHFREVHFREVNFREVVPKTETPVSLPELIRHRFAKFLAYFMVYNNITPCNLNYSKMTVHLS